MEGHVVSAMDLFGVSKNAELSDRLPSPNSWSLWGSRETFSFPEKTSTVDSNSASEEFCPGSAGGAESSSVFKGLSNQNLWLNSAPSDSMDFQLDDLEGAQADELFLNSLLEDFPGSERFHGQYCACPHCVYEISPSGNLWPNDSQSIESQKQYMDSSKCSESQCFSPSLGWEKEITAPQSVPCNTEQETVPSPKALLVNILVPSEHSELHEYQDEEMPLEESVLQDLKVVMAQLNKKTRICFRDALYRLADSSKQHDSAMDDQSGGLDEEKLPPWTEHDQNIMSEKKTVESETNIIDRAIANIMFNRMDFNDQDLSVESQESAEHQIHKEADMFQYQSLETSMFPHDHEVPVLAQSDLTRRNGDPA